MSLKENQIDKVRTKLWAREVFAALDCSSAAEFIRAAGSAQGGVSPLADLKWYEYEKAKRIPAKDTLALVDSYFLNSSVVFLQGPYGLPVWKLAVCDIEESWIVLDRFLVSVMGENSKTRTIEDKAIFLFKNLVSKDYQEVGRIFLGGRLPMWFPDNLLGEMPHVAPERIIIEMQKTGEFPVNLVDYSFGLYLDDKEDINFSSSAILSALALLNISESLKNRVAKKLAIYLLLGLKKRAISHEFSEYSDIIIPLIESRLK